MPPEAIQAALPFASALGAVSALLLLAWAYGPVRRRLPGRTLAPQILGALFGAVSVLTMQASGAPGGPADLRLVPVALSGAFLGARGLVLCLVVAAAGRVTLPGATLAPDLVALMLAGAAGLLWDGVSAGSARRRLGAMLGLVAMTSAHHLALLLLPTDVARDVLWGALPALAATAVAIPLVGRILEAERLAALSEDRARALIRLRPDHGFPPLARLQAELSDALAGGRFEAGVAILRVRLRPGLAHAPFWGDEVGDIVLRTLRRRIEPLLPAGAMWGLTGAGRVAVILPAPRAGELDSLADALRREVAAAPIEVPGAPSARPRLRMDIASFDDLPPPEVLFASGTMGGGPLPPAPPGPGDRRLFERAERLLAHQRLKAREASIELEAGAGAGPTAPPPH